MGAHNATTENPDATFLSAFHDDQVLSASSYM